MDEQQNLNRLYILDYDINKSRNINFLLDYSLELMEYELQDQKILNWQSENAYLLKRCGMEIKHSELPIVDILDFNQADDKFFDLTLGDGNFNEMEIVKNLRKKEIPELSLLNKKKKRNESASVFSHDSEIKDKICNALLEVSNPNADSDRFDDSIGRLTSNKNSDSFASLLNNLKKTDFSLFSMNEAFECVVKEFLNIEKFPTEPRHKLTLMRKFLPLYKKIKCDKFKLANFLQKLSDKLNEDVEDIKTLFEFDYIRNKREGSFANLSKLIKKFANALIHNRIQDIRDITTINDSPMIRDRFVHLQNKISVYLELYKQIIEYFDKEVGEVYSKQRLIEKFIPSFKLSKFISEEGIEKVTKRVKETFMKNNIVFNDYLYNSMILKGEYPSRYIENEEMVNERDSPGMEPLFSPKNREEPFNNQEIEMCNLLQIPMFNTNYDLEVENKIYKYEKMESSIFTVNSEGCKFPVSSKKYLTKQYDKFDFLDDEDK